MRKVISRTLLVLVGCFSGAYLFSGNSIAEEIKRFEAKRIVALSPHSVEMLYAIGAGKRIVGTVEYADYPKEALSIPRIGNYTGIQIERLVALEPDLIVTWISGNKSSDLEKIRSLGFRVFDSKPKNISAIANEIRALGQLTGLKEKSNRVADDILNKYKAIKSHYSARSSIDVFYQLWHDPLRTVGPKSWISSMIADCNGRNIFADTDSDYPLVSFESVLVKNPAVIIIPHHSGNIGAKSDIWNKWKSVTAVKNKNMAVLNGDLLHRFGPRAIEGLDKLCEAIDSARSEG